MVCNFWRLSKALERPLFAAKSFSGSCMGWLAFGERSIMDCVDTTGYCFRIGFWEGQGVSTPLQAVSTPQANYVDTQVD
ncbi:hypothetical protein Taro_009667, partial [Colocasia esculenta]|nr:hypothetical protein [Colocasia esculenta]